MPASAANAPTACDKSVLSEGLSHSAVAWIPGDANEQLGRPDDRALTPTFFTLLPVTV